jgi:hypothetical protein
MKAIFEVRTINASWKPPFNKEIKEETYKVSENSSFDRIVGNGFDEPVFNLISFNSNVAVVTYSKVFTLKGLNPSDRKIVLNQNDFAEITYLWGENGSTKKITFKGIDYSSDSSDDGKVNLDESSSTNESLDNDSNLNEDSLNGNSSLNDKINSSSVICSSEKKVVYEDKETLIC